MVILIFKFNFCVSWGLVELVVNDEHGGVRNQWTINVKRKDSGSLEVFKDSFWKNIVLITLAPNFGYGGINFGIRIIK